MGRPYEFVNVTKMQYYRYSSSALYEDGINVLLYLYQNKIWDVTDEVVHGHYILEYGDCMEEEDFAAVDKVEEYGAYYNKKLVTSIN